MDKFHRIRHDCTQECVRFIAEMLGNLLNESEMCEFRAYCQQAVYSAIEMYEIRVDRQRQRLKPFDN